ncbi:hypothetical protein Ocin01_10073 [Orchesella cincta]|uniref:Transmembrane protein n=1 Tax=Orchesella cincta TaxID=48709 RepID=A0A1D2MU33_ORCCI|nr:hypothetical protein Ocin01_10073 [Orchesella cincta]
MLHPCCGRDLQKSAKTVAVFDIILSVIELIAAMVFESEEVTIVTEEVPNPKQRDINYILTITLLFSILLVILKIIQLCVSILLLYGSVERDYRKCQIWFLFGCVLIGIAVLVIIFETTVRDKLVSSDTELWMRLIIPISEILVNWYLMWVIYAFMRELKRDGATASATVFLKEKA